MQAFPRLEPFSRAWEFWGAQWQVQVCVWKACLEINGPFVVMKGILWLACFALSHAWTNYIKPLDNWWTLQGSHVLFMTGDAEHLWQFLCCAGVKLLQYPECHHFWEMDDLKEKSNDECHSCHKHCTSVVPFSNLPESWKRKGGVQVRQMGLRDLSYWRSDVYL